MPKLVLAVVCWVILFLFWENRTTLTPIARNWISDPVLELRLALDKHLTREQRIHISYLLPGIYPIPYACGRYTSSRELAETLLPGDRFKIKTLDGTSVVCGNDLVLRPFNELELVFSRGGTGPSFNLISGAFGWSTESANRVFSFRFSYMMAEVVTKTANSQGIASIDAGSSRIRLSSGSGIGISAYRKVLPNFETAGFLVAAENQPLQIHDFGQVIKVSPNEQILLTATSARRLTKTQ